MHYKVHIIYIYIILAGVGWDNQSKSALLILNEESPPMPLTVYNGEKPPIWVSAPWCSALFSEIDIPTFEYWLHARWNEWSKQKSINISNLIVLIQDKMSAPNMSHIFYYINDTCIGNKAQ